MSEINPVEYGKLVNAVENLEHKVNSMDNDIKRLVAMAERSKGSLWALMGVASVAGAFISYLTEIFFKKQGLIIDPLTILATFAPFAVDLGKSLINRFIAGDTFKPAHVDEYIKMREIDLSFFKAMNDAGGTNPSYLWVEAVVRMMRPAVTIIVLGTWCYLELNHQSSATVTNFASAVGFYLFGDRTLFYAKKVG